MKSACTGAVCVVLALGSVAQAAPLMLTDMLGDLEATVKFEVSGTDLVITLTNSSAADVLVPVDVLTGLFFDVDAPGLLGLGRTSAVLGAGSSVMWGTTDPGDGVGGEWAYLEGISAHGRSYGIGSAGFGVFGPMDLFPGSDLQPPVSPDGLNYGIVSAGDNPLTGNAPVTGPNALIKNEVVFTLSGVPAGFDPSTQIERVLFQYGTSLDDPSIPEPATFALIGMIGAGITLQSRRKSKHA